MKMTIKVQFKDDIPHANVREQKTFKDSTTYESWYQLSDKMQSCIIKYLAHEEWNNRGYDVTLFGNKPNRDRMIILSADVKFNDKWGEIKNDRKRTWH